MIVADLSRHFAEIRRLLDASGARGQILKDMDAIVDALTPFKQLGLEQFADFLKRAEAYSRGEVPLESKAKASGGRKKTPASKTNIVTLAADAKRIFDGAGQPHVTNEVIDAFSSQLEGLKKADLDAIAVAIGFRFATKDTIPQRLEAIKVRIEEKKNSIQRSHLINRHTESTPTGSMASEPA